MSGARVRQSPNSRQLFVANPGAPTVEYSTTKPALIAEVRTLRNENAQLRSEIRRLTKRVRELEGGAVELRREMNETTRGKR